MKIKNIRINGTDYEIEGKSAYDLYKEAHPEYTGTLEEWLDSLKGEKGDPGKNGAEGIITKTAQGNPLHIKDAIAVTEVLVTGGEAPAHNILNNTAASTTVNGLTFTVNPDKSVTVSGTATAETDLKLTNASPMPLDAGTYYLSGCPSGGGYSTYFIRALIKDGNINSGTTITQSIDSGEGAAFTAAQDYPNAVATVILRVFPNATLNGVTFYPMITTEQGAEYAPYNEGDTEIMTITVTNNTSGDSVSLPVEEGGTVTDVPAWEDMTLTAPQGATISAKYQVPANYSEKLADHEEKLADHEERLAALEGGAGGGETEVRPYFADEVEQTAATIIEKTMTAPCLVLNVVSDSHENLTDPESVRVCSEMYENLKAVNARVHCDALVHLGDSCGSSQVFYPDWTSVVTHLHSTRKRLSECNDHAVMLVGNHDGISSLYPDERKTYNAMYAHTRDYVHRNGASSYGYMDFPDLKVRCIFLATSVYSAYSDRGTTSLGWAQAQWVADVVSATEDGWHILAFAHYSPFDEGYLPTKNYAASKQYEAVLGVLAAFNNHTTYSFKYSSDLSLNLDFSTKTSTKTVGLFTGHGHYDRVMQDNTYVTNYALPFPVIMTACARLEQENEIPDDNSDGAADADVVTPARATMTVTQDLWDTLVYNPTEGKVSMIRFGAGEDREITLNQ